ncbi:MAG: methyltransferase [SAR86 cluster bacterium]|uniref:Methyltransferase n=1 Tax=SAR86 cluster bacterium TaxID=2030880 RepID=A0A2A4WV45_9GAMM|nr:MAG: methyltransferase [SAR86 cluster bacterium]
MHPRSLNLCTLLFLLAGLVVAHSASAQLLSEAERQQLQTLIVSPERGEELQARNQYRNPLATLDFFEVTPELTVVEIWPGGQGGWYRSILEPYIEGRGNYIPVRESPEFPESVPQVAANSADRVLVFRAHGFMIYEHPAQDYFDALYGILKPGGIFGIVDHRGNEAVPQDPEGESGYVNQSHVIMLAENAGFELVEQAEINANAADSKDHPEGVYSLPPTLRGSFINRRLRGRMQEIGESDRMTLKFTKKL